jgi:hypothetical protein
MKTHWIQISNGGGGMYSMNEHYWNSALVNVKARGSVRIITTAL